LKAALFSIVLEKCLPDNIQIQLDYCKRIYFQSNETISFNSMSLLCSIKQHQLPVSSIELEIEQITEEED
jgi:hypothetical protein